MIGLRAIRIDLKLLLTGIIFPAMGFKEKNNLNPPLISVQESIFFRFSASSIFIITDSADSYP
jgi:hypothetical protein